MRCLTIALALASILIVNARPGWSASTQASESSTSGDRHTVQRGKGADSVETIVSGGGPSVSTGRQPSGGRRAGGAKRQAPVFYAEKPRIDRAPDGSACLTIVRIPAASALEAGIIEDTGNIVWREMYRDFPRCPPAVRVTVPPAPAAMAGDFWRVEIEDRLDRPKPRIAPGYMLAGKLGYLETNTKMTDRFVHQTPLGLLVINTKGRIFVDWGDGTGVSGPYGSAGKPWPDGTITHSWSDADRYDIVVTERWTATWELAGQRGTLDGLTTTGRIEDFEVRQLQAVRTR